MSDYLPKVTVDGEGPFPGPEFDVVLHAIQIERALEVGIQRARAKAIALLSDGIKERFVGSNPKFANDEYRLGVAECLFAISPQVPRYIEEHNYQGGYSRPFIFANNDKDKSDLTGVTKFAEALIVVAKLYGMEISGHYNGRGLTVLTDSDAEQVVVGFYEPTVSERIEAQGVSLRLERMMEHGIYVDSAWQP